MRYNKVQERWTADVLKYKLPDGKRIMDCVTQSRAMETDFDPMYSSFSKNFQFYPPMSSKDAAIQKQLKDLIKKNEVDSMSKKGSTLTFGGAPSDGAAA